MPSLCECPLKPIGEVSLGEIHAAQQRLEGLINRTPLVKLETPGDLDIWLKLENLQSIGSFKVRGSGNAMELMDPKLLSRGVYTASAGNMAQGVAWNARRLGVPCGVVVPEQAPRTKLAAIEWLGATVLRVPYDEWWEVIRTHRHAGFNTTFIHPVSDPAVIAGNGTIGLEILEDLDGLDAVIVPFGGGGLSCGISSAIKALNPGVSVYAAEIETATPLAASLAAGAPVAVEHHASFVDGIGGKSVLPEMWPLARRLLDGSLVVSLEHVAAAIRTLVKRACIVAEGAGATSVAAALQGRTSGGRIVCIVSGGNIDTIHLSTILSGDLP